MREKFKSKKIILFLLIFVLVSWSFGTYKILTRFKIMNEMLSSSIELTSLDKRDYPLVLRKNLNDNLGLRDLLSDNKNLDGVSDLSYKSALYNLDQPFYFKIFEDSGELTFFDENSSFPQADKDSNIIINFNDSSAYEKYFKRLKENESVYLQVSRDYVLEFKYRGLGSKLASENEKFGRELLTINVADKSYIFSLDRLPSIYTMQEMIYSAISFRNNLPVIFFALSALFIILALGSLLIFKQGNKGKAKDKREKKYKGQDKYQDLNKEKEKDQAKDRNKDEDE